MEKIFEERLPWHRPEVERLTVDLDTGFEIGSQIEKEGLSWHKPEVYKLTISLDTGTTVGSVTNDFASG